MIRKVLRFSTCPYSGGKHSPEMAQLLSTAVPPGSSSVVRVENNTGKELKPSEAVCALDTALALGPVSQGSQVAVLLRDGEFSPSSP